jgi:hypothetical protein
MTPRETLDFLWQNAPVERQADMDKFLALSPHERIQLCYLMLMQICTMQQQLHRQLGLREDNISPGA